MYCSYCGADDDNNVIKRNIEEDGDIITITYYGKCSECGNLLGEKEIFRLKEKDCFKPNEEEIY